MKTPGSWIKTLGATSGIFPDRDNHDPRPRRMSEKFTVSKACRILCRFSATHPKHSKGSTDPGVPFGLSQ